MTTPTARGEVNTHRAKHSHSRRARVAVPSAREVDRDLRRISCPAPAAAELHDALITRGELLLRVLQLLLGQQEQLLQRASRAWPAAAQPQSAGPGGGDPLGNLGGGGGAPLVARVGGRAGPIAPARIARVDRLGHAGGGCRIRGQRLGRRGGRRRRGRRGAAAGQGPEARRVGRVEVGEVGALGALPLLDGELEEGGDDREDLVEGGGRARRPPSSVLRRYSWSVSRSCACSRRFFSSASTSSASRSPTRAAPPSRP